MSRNLIHQKSKDTIWYDESGTAIPYNRITKAERLMERHASVLLKGAQGINASLVKFKMLIEAKCKEAYEAAMEENKSNPNTKGNFTWYNFNRSIKIEVKINRRIVFDDLTIQAAKSKIEEFLDGSLQSKNALVKEMAIDAFKTRGGRLDANKILDLTSWESRVNDPLFSEGVKLINKAIRRPHSKTYFRIWLKNSSGEYDNVDLNFSSI